MVVKDDLIIQESLKIQLKQIVDYVQQHPDFWDTIEEKPFKVGNQMCIGHINPMKCLKIEMKISLTDLKIEGE